MKLFYDSYCPLCRAEMAHLKKCDKDNKVELIDIHSRDFQQRYPQYNMQALNARIHAQLDDGTVVTGLDATYAAWRAAGRGWLYAPLRWPVIRLFADTFYRWFAKHRYTLSYVLTGKRRSCSDDRCEISKGK